MEADVEGVSAPRRLPSSSASPSSTPSLPTVMLCPSGSTCVSPGAASPLSAAIVIVSTMKQYLRANLHSGPYPGRVDCRVRLLGDDVMPKVILVAELPYSSAPAPPLPCQLPAR